MFYGNAGNIGLPVPPRSQKSLEIPSYYYYVTPNEASGKFRVPTCK